MSIVDARRPNPFPGLRPFRSDEHHLFFGREEQTAALLQLLRTNRFLAVVGTSGSGKSSLVRAGMIAALHGGTMTQAGSTWEVMILRPGGSPIENLARAFVDAELYDGEDPGTLPRLLATLNRSRFGLVEAMKQSEVFEPGTNLLVVVDQFEELFRFRQQGIDSEETAAAFVNLLLTASEQAECPIYIAITMRSDYLGDCSEIPGLAEAVNDGEYLIPRLLRDQKRDAIEKPIGVGGAKISPLLVQRLLNEVGDDPDQLPVLQHALMRMWEAWSDGGDQARPIEFSDFEATGGLASALSNHADEIYDALPDDRHRSVCEKIFKTLTEKGEDNRGIRRPTRLAQLQAIADSDREVVTTVLDAFRGSGVTFLMPGPEVGLDDRTVLDLSHESLMRGWQRLRGWVDDEAQSARVFRRLLDTARLWKDGKAGLFRDPDLQIALSWREQEAPNAEWAEQYGGHFETAIGFLETSNAEAEAERQAKEAARQRELAQAQELAESQRVRLEQQQRSARKLRKMIAGLAAVAVIAVLACVAALVAHQRARQNEENAKNNEEKAKRSASRALQSQQDANEARAASEQSREAAQAEAYRAVLSEARALRAGREPGWRDQALAHLSRLATSPYPKRDMLELRTEAVAALGTPDVQLIGQTDPSSGASSFAMHPDGQTLVTVDGQSGLDFWNVRDLRHVATSEAMAVKQPATIWRRNRAVYIPIAQGFAVSTRDQGILFTDLSGKRTSRPPIMRGTDAPSQMAIDAEGRRIAVSWEGGRITVHDLASGKTLAELLGYVCAISPDGNWLAYAGPQFEVRLYPLDSVETEKTLGHHDGKIARFAFSADGKMLGTGSEDHTATLWDVFGRKQPVVLRGHRDTVNDVAFSPDGGWVATVSTDFTARIWDAATGQSLATLPGPTFLVDAGWTSDGAILAVGNGYHVSLYRVTGRQMFQRLAMHRHGVQCVAADPRQDRFATGADDHKVINWSLATTLPSSQWIETDSQYVTAVAYSPDGSLLATGTGYGALVVRDAETREVKANLGTQKHGIPGLAFDPTGQLLASGDRKGHVILWNLATRQPMHTLQVGSAYVWSIAFLEDGRKLVALAWNGPLILFDLETGKPEKQVMVPGGARRFVADPARKRLVVSGNDGDLFSLSIPDLTEDFRLARSRPSAIESLALSPDGRLLATGGADRRVVIRDPVTFAPLLAFPEWTGNIKDLAFTLAGRRLAYVGADSDVALWDLTRLHEDLKTVGLAWDQPAPAVVSASGPATDGPRVRPAAPIIRRGGAVDVAAFTEAQRLLSSGVNAYQNGRPAEAIRDLEQARDQFRALRKTSSPTNSAIASRLSISLTFLGSAFKDEDRPEEALATFKEAREVLEGMRQPAAVDHYNLACAYAYLTILVDPGSAPPTPAEREALAEKAVAALGRSFAAGKTDFDSIERDSSLDPLRERPDFQILVIEAAGRFGDAVPYLAQISAASPRDTLLPIKVAALQAWFGQEKDLAATCQRILALEKDTNDPTTAERTAKACSLRPSSESTRQAALLLARRAVELGQGKPLLAYYHLAQGMAEYRSGHYPEADVALLAAARVAGSNNYAISVTAPFYQAMSLFRQGNADEARKLATAAAAKMKPLPIDEQNPLAGNASHDDLIVWLAYKEARELIKFGAIPTSAPSGAATQPKKE